MMHIWRRVSAASAFLAPAFLAACLLITVVAPQAASGQDRWRVMPIRSQEEFNLGMIGGEATQHLHSIARSVSNPDLIYLSHDCGQFWKSTDGGNRWQKTLGAGCPVHAGQSIEVDPVNADIVFAVVDATYNYFVENYEGLYRSTDGGESWQLLLHADAESQRMYQHNIAYDPTSTSGGKAQRWYVGFPAGNLYRSENGGDTWTQVSSLGAHTTLYAVMTHPTDGNTVYVASSQGLYVSTTRGTNLQPLGNLPAGAISGIDINRQNPDEIYAVLRGSGLYRSTNGGSTFSLRRSFDAARVFLNPAYPNMVYLIGLSTQSMVSSNGGTSWTSFTVTPAPGLGREWKTTISGELSGVVPDPRDANVAICYSNAQLWKSTDAGRHWVDSSTLFTGYAWGWWQSGLAFDVADPGRFAMFCCDVSLVTTGNGGDWFTRYRVPWEWYQQGLISWPGMYAGDIQPIAGSQTIVGSTGMYFDTKLVRTTDGGANWQIVSNESENHLFVAFHPSDPNLVFAGNKRSTDAGVTWQAISYLDGYSASIFGMCRAQPDTLYAVSRPRNRILRSDDRGVSWRTYATVGWYLNSMDSKPTFAADPADPDKVYTLSSTGDLATFNGTTWTSLGVLPLASGAQYHNYVRAVAIDPRHPEIIYAGMHACGLPCVFRSTDSGSTWQDITSNLPRLGGAGIIVHPLTGDLLHGSCFGTWVYPPPYESPDSLYARLHTYGASVTGWQTVAVHGAAGEVAMNVADGDVEPRLGGLRKLRVMFSDEMDPATLGPGVVTISGAASGDQSALVDQVSLDAGGTVLTVTLSAALPDADTYTVAVTDVLKDLGGDPVGGDAELVISALAGDVNGSGRVTPADILASRGAAGQPLGPASCRYDVDGSGGIAGSDLLAVRSRLGAGLP